MSKLIFRDLLANSSASAESKNQTSATMPRDEESMPVPPIQEKDSNIVGWDINDRDNPVNWCRNRKWTISLCMGLMTFVCTFASSVFSTATIATSKLFGVSTEVMTLGVSLYVLGFAFGPTLWGPLSELYGRKVPLFTGYAIFAIFQIPVAVAQNLETLFVCRFLGGVFGAAPLAIVGGAMADIWDPVDRGVAICLFAGATFIGPAAGPILGGFIVDSHLGWRWTAYITLIIAAFFGTIGFIVIPETYAPKILRLKATRLRHQSRNWALHAKAEESTVDLQGIATKYLFRPYRMLAVEPILILLTMYMALVYGILYLFFEAYPINFQEHRGWTEGLGALPFLGITVGVFAGCSTTAYITKTRFRRKFIENGRVIPEERLPPMIIGSFLLPIGLFWFAWTSNPNIHWASSVVAGIPMGAGIVMIFMQCLNYIIDVFKINANSAISANVLVRSVIGGAFPLFASAMYHRLGVAWATSLLGFLTVAMLPVPILFYIYGERIRKMSRYSPGP